MKKVNNYKKVFLLKLKNLFKNREFWFVVLLFLVGAFLRFYRLEDLMVYLGDEGRDMLIVRDIIRGKNLPFIGPPTSVGQLYLGPIYYYFITPFVWLFNMSPIGPAVFVALLSSLTIPLIYIVAKKFFGSTGAVFSSILYTFSPLIIKFSRSSWNPNPMPFFSLLLLLFLYLWKKTKKVKHLVLAAASFAVMLQLHYMAIVLAPYLLFLLFKIGEENNKLKDVLKAFLIFIILLSPLIFFDLKHDFVNVKGFIEIFQSRSTKGFSFLSTLSLSRDRLRQLFSAFLGIGERDFINNIVVVLVMLFSLKGFFSKKEKIKFSFYGLFFWSLLALGLYRQSVYPHYLGFLFPFPALLLGGFLGKVYKKNILTKLFSLLSLGLILFNFIKLDVNYLNQPSVLNVNLVKKIVRLIEKESGDKEFNFALLAKNNYDASYRYFFKLWNIPGWSVVCCL